VKENEGMEVVMLKRSDAIAALIFLLAGMSPSFAADSGPILGVWKLLSYEVELLATGQREFTPNMGKNPTGNILFTADGRMMVVITGEGRKPATSDQDRAGLYTSVVAYTGTYRVKGNQWFTKVEVSANPAWVGMEQARFFKVEGDRLQEMTPPMQWALHPEKGMVRFILTYERAK
jgi:hypothetical protein